MSVKSKSRITISAKFHRGGYSPSFFVHPSISIDHYHLRLSDRIHGPNHHCQRSNKELFDITLKYINHQTSIKRAGNKANTKPLEGSKEKDKQNDSTDANINDHLNDMNTGAREGDDNRNVVEEENAV